MVTPETIRLTAIEMANSVGIINLTRIDLCSRLNISDGSFSVIAGRTFTELIELIRPDCNTKGMPKPDVKRRTSAANRTEHILSVAMDVAERDGFAKLSRNTVAEECGISDSLIAYHFGTMPQFRRDIMRYAIKTERLGIIAEGLATRDVHALKAPEELKARALASLSQSQD